MTDHLRRKPPRQRGFRARPIPVMISARRGFDLVTEPIGIGDGCWVAAGAFVGRGAEVPAGTMVKAGEVWKILEP